MFTNNTDVVHTRHWQQQQQQQHKGKKKRRRWHAFTILVLLVTSTILVLVLYVELLLYGWELSDVATINNVAVIVSSSISSSRNRRPTIDSIKVVKPRATIAYAVSLTSCGTDTSGSSSGGGHSHDASFHEGAAVLKHSIHLSSIRNNNNHNNDYNNNSTNSQQRRRRGSIFDYQMIAFVHPSATHCSHIFTTLGYQVLIRNTPFNISDIQGEFFREHIGKSGCCGEKEYIKLYAYTLVDYPIVVHLDLDTLLLQPLDDLFLAMLGHDENEEEEMSSIQSRIPIMYNKSLPTNTKSIAAYFTRDYNMINPGHKHVGVQGGLLIVKPNMDAFHEYLAIVLKGKFANGAGWYDHKGGETYGGYFGAQQIQGIVSFYYDYYHPNTGIELNRCYINAMADAPRNHKGLCRDGQPICEDCRLTNVNDIMSVHFTLCNKPWKCPFVSSTSSQQDSICNMFHTQWFRIRHDLEKTLILASKTTTTSIVHDGNEYTSLGQGRYMPEIFHGYCNSHGERGYIPLSTTKKLG
jgi:hypothetical protein